MDVTYKLQVLNKEGVSTGRFADFSCFEGVKVNDHLLFLNVKSYLANQRQGTHKSKSRSEISGSTRKLIRQKGSGGARRGDINSPLLRGGGRVFGPMPNDYNNKINKKEKLLAFCAAFKCSLENNSVFVVVFKVATSPKVAIPLILPISSIVYKSLPKSPTLFSTLLCPPEIFTLPEIEFCCTFSCAISADSLSKPTGPES